jgi:hypothetical protein
MLYVMYDATDVVVCTREQVKLNKEVGMKVYGRGKTQFEIENLVAACERI